VLFLQVGQLELFMTTHTRTVLDARNLREI